MSEPIQDGTEEYPGRARYEELQAIFDETMHEMLRMRGIQEHSIITDYVVVISNSFVDEEGDYDADLRFILGPGGYMPAWKTLGLLHGAIEKMRQPVVLHESYLAEGDDDDADGEG